MKTAIVGFTVALLLFAATSVSASELPKLEMKTVHELSPELLTGSQPSQADLAALKAGGLTTVINLRGSTEELGYDEKAAAETLGLRYVSIPIVGAADITPENAAKLDAALRTVDGKVLLHCASSNRVGALLALRAAAAGQTPDEAIAFGKSAGLSSLESAVRQQLTPAAVTDSESRN